MELAEIDYALPEGLIAQEPLARRDASRLLVVRRDEQHLEHRRFDELPEYLRPGDLVVVNNTKVLHARLRGVTAAGHLVEVLLIEALGEDAWQCLVKPAKRMHRGDPIQFGASPVRAQPVAREGEFWRLQFACPCPPTNNSSGRREPANGLLESLLEEQGEVPLPPYIHRLPTPMDAERYQTVFAEAPGAVAAPTAGLHFTEAMLARLRAAGIRVAEVTLHTSYGTFAPIREDDPRRHRMHREWYEVPEETAVLINQTKAHGKRVIAVGTTTCRALETMATQRTPPYHGQQGWTDLFIFPPFQFRVVDVFLTNFHAPRSSLLLLISAFINSEFWRVTYAEAIQRRYRFLSYGDAMLML